MSEIKPESNNNAVAPESNENQDVNQESNNNEQLIADITKAHQELSEYMNQLIFPENLKQQSTAQLTEILKTLNAQLSTAKTIIEAVEAPQEAPNQAAEAPTGGSRRRKSKKSKKRKTRRKTIGKGKKSSKRRK